MNDTRFNPNATFREVLAAAIEDISSTGYVSPSRIEEWAMLLRNVAERELGTDYAVNEEVRAAFERLFERAVGGTKLDKRVEGLSRYTKAMVKPKLYDELDRRIIAAADLIKLHKREAVERTLQRFRGWSTSIPPGGTDDVNRRTTRRVLSKEIRDYRYHRRLVDNDQGHKLIANVAQLVAEEAGAIAGVWHSHGTSDASYDARKDHLDRAGKTYLIRGSWAHKEGLIKPVNGYTDEITAPGQQISCRCWLSYITSPRRLPDAMLTKRGQEWIAHGRDELAKRMAS